MATDGSARPEKRPRIHLVASLGGHLELLVGLDECFEGYDRVWVTAAGDGAASLIARGDRVCAVPRLSRARPWTAIGNVTRSFMLAMRERPERVVTVGAGSVVAFSTFARLLGARTTFVETTARVTSPSASGRVLARLASSVIVQWPEMARVYPRAVVCRPALWEDVEEPSRRERSGTFVAVGTHRHQFDRLLEVVDHAVEAKVLPQPVVAQGGTCRYRPKNFDVRAYMSREELTDAIDGAEYVVCHAGSGIISAALRRGHMPLVMPRLARHHEHVDNHQVQIVEKLGSLGLIVPLGDQISAREVAKAEGGVGRPASNGEPSVREMLSLELESHAGSTEAA